MRTRRILSLLVLGVAVNVMIATGSHQGSNLSGHEKKAANSTGFRLSLVIKNNQVKLHEPVLIDFLIRNVTKTTLVLEETVPERQYDIVIKDWSGKLVALTERGRALQNNKGQDFRVLPLRVKPHAQNKDTIDVASLYDLAVPGVYQVSATRRVQKLNSSLWTDVSSNTLTITVLP
jgi:hypothetical protein